MVFESLITPQTAEKRPWELFFLGFLYASLGIALSLWIFRSQAGLVSVFITVMTCIPLMYGTFRFEEEKIDDTEEEKSLIKEHSKAMWFFVYLFLGMTLGFATWFVALPLEVSQSVFSVQIHTIFDINGMTDATGNAINQNQLFSKIFFNNMKVLTFCLLFSFFFGAGAIFLLAWNASVIAVAMGSLIKNYVLASGTNTVSTHLMGYLNSMLRYFIHGVPEILAYFVAALAGGIISVAVMRKDFSTKNFQKIVFDTSNLILLSLFILVVAAVIEAYITPYFY